MKKIKKILLMKLILFILSDNKYKYILLDDNKENENNRINLYRFFNI